MKKLFQKGICLLLVLLVFSTLTAAFADEHHHTMPLQYVSEKAPTCTENGRYVYFQCSVCGACFLDAGATVPTTAAAQTIPALGHVLTEWSPNGSNHSLYCTRCNVHNYKDHVFHKVTVNGKECTVCAICGQAEGSENYSYVKYKSWWQGPGHTFYSGSFFGRLVVRILAEPYPEESEIGAAFTVVFENGGIEGNLRQLVEVGIPLDLPEGTKLYYVDTANGTETRTEVEYKYHGGAMTFDTKNQGIYLLVNEG